MSIRLKLLLLLFGLLVSLMVCLQIGRCAAVMERVS